MRFRNLLMASGAAIVAFAATGASAEPDGWYGAVDAGMHWADDINTTHGGPVDWDWEASPDGGWLAAARLGYRFNPNWRMELEGAYRSGDIGTVRNEDGSAVAPSGLCNLTPAAPGPCHSPDGDIEAMTLMVNAIYDFGSADSTFRPFVGLGAGVNRVSIDTIGRLRGIPGSSFSADDSSTNFAWQALAGFAWAMGDRSNLDLTYRYLSSDAEWESAGAPGLGTFEGDYEDHSVTLGLRYAFGAPTPPPPPHLGRRPRKLHPHTKIRGRLQLSRAAVGIRLESGGEVPGCAGDVPGAGWSRAGALVRGSGLTSSLLVDLLPVVTRTLPERALQ